MRNLKNAFTLITVLAGFFAVAQSQNKTFTQKIMKEWEPLIERSSLYSFDGKVVAKIWTGDSAEFVVFDLVQNEIRQSEKIAFDKFSSSFLTFADDSTLKTFYSNTIYKNDESFRDIHCLTYNVRSGNYTNRAICETPGYLFKMGFKEQINGNFYSSVFSAFRSSTKKKSIIVYRPEAKNPDEEMRFGVIMLNELLEMEWHQEYDFPFDREHASISDWAVDDDGIAHAFFAIKNEDAKKRQKNYNGIYIASFNKNEIAKISQLNFTKSSFGSHLEVFKSDKEEKFGACMGFMNESKPELMIFDIEDKEKLRPIVSISIYDELKNAVEKMDRNNLFYTEQQLDEMLPYYSLQIKEIRILDSGNYLIFLRDRHVVYGDSRYDYTKSLTVLNVSSSFEVNWIRKIPIHSSSTYYGTNNSILNLKSDQIEVINYVNRENLGKVEKSKLLMMRAYKPKKTQPSVLLKHSLSLKSGVAETTILLDTEDLGLTKKTIAHTSKVYRKDNNSWVTILKTTEGLKLFTF